jgi:hypothetical protein
LSKRATNRLDFLLFNLVEVLHQQVSIYFGMHISCRAVNEKKSTTSTWTVN